MDPYHPKLVGPTAKSLSVLDGTEGFAPDCSVGLSRLDKVSQLSRMLGKPSNLESKSRSPSPWPL